MFCDLAGFTALSERLGPEEAYSTMDQVYEILIHQVHDFGGTVNEMTGDGIMALFGAPIALEDAPQRAIRAGHAIHLELTRFNQRVRKEKPDFPPLRMRIGVNSGPVVVGTLGNDLRVEFKAVGDTVNLASRMEQLAEPGTTCVSEATFKLTEGFFRFEALGAKEVKGKGTPQKTYRVVAPSSTQTRFDVSAERGLTRFVGRARELELLLDGLERAKTGRGQAVSVVAEAGVGKSRLLYEFQKAIANEGHHLSRRPLSLLQPQRRVSPDYRHPEIKLPDPGGRRRSGHPGKSSQGLEKTDRRPGFDPPLPARAFFAETGAGRSDPHESRGAQGADHRNRHPDHPQGFRTPSPGSGL